ncbi:VOC family protein [Modestobacter sp. I12A-02662]|uniref:VOC family protein n=1 Tax=Modestobacter sp. I12A-02662 TaxID=1730496 RepID=UPI0034DF0077
MTMTDAAAGRSTTPTLGAITHVALTVQDLGVSVPFYRELIGADPVLDEDTGPFRHVVFAMGDTLLGLHHFPEGIEDVAHTPRRRGLDHVSFGCADRGELEAWQRRLDRMGIEHGGIVDAHYGSGLSFKDPDGLPLELFCPPSA